MTFWTNQQSDYTPKDLGVRPKPIMKVRYLQTSNIVCDRTLGRPVDSWVVFGDRATVFQPHCIERNLVGNKLPHHSDVVEASPAGAAPTTSSFSTKHMASMDWTTARRDEYPCKFWDLVRHILEIWRNHTNASLLQLTAYTSDLVDRQSGSWGKSGSWISTPDSNSDGS